MGNSSAERLERLRDKLRQEGCRGVSRERAILKILPAIRVLVSEFVETFEILRIRQTTRWLTSFTTRKPVCLAVSWPRDIVSASPHTRASAGSRSLDCSPTSPPRQLWLSLHCFMVSPAEVPRWLISTCSRAHALRLRTHEARRRHINVPAI